MENILTCTAKVYSLDPKFSVQIELCSMFHNNIPALLLCFHCLYHRIRSPTLSYHSCQMCLGTGKYKEIPKSCSKAQHQVSHPVCLLPFLNHRREETGKKGWSANFQIKLAMFFSKIPHHPDERLKETDTDSSV